MKVQPAITKQYADILKLGKSFKMLAYCFRQK